VTEVWRETRSSEPRALMVGPQPLTPFTRTVIVDAGDRYETATFSWWGAAVTFDPQAVPKNDGHPAVAAARQQSQDIRDLLVWSRFPFWIVQDTRAGTRVFLADMRFPEAVTAPGAWFVAHTLLPARGSQRPQEMD
jgi:hypothetical protein